MEKSIKILTTMVLVLLLGNLYFGTQYVVAQRQVVQLNQALAVKESNVKKVAFLNLFINKVLKNNSEVSFDDRLKLENAVRDLGDGDILHQWEKFTASQSEREAQQEVTNLLALLASKITY